jgi:hypothetical protein
MVAAPAIPNGHDQTAAPSFAITGVIVREVEMEPE